MATLMAIQKHVTDDARIRELSVEVRMCLWRCQRFSIPLVFTPGQWDTYSIQISEQYRHMQVERLKTKLGEVHNSDVHQLKCVTMRGASCTFNVVFVLFEKVTCASQSILQRDWEVLTMSATAGGRIVP
jgi:hypothetical protein